MSRDILPFPLSFCPTAAEISLSVNAGKAQTRLAKGTEVTLDAYIQEAGLEAWTFLVTWALNFVYCNRHAERAERPESLSAAQQKALVQLKKYIRGFLSGPAVPHLDWGSELASTRIDYNGEEVKTAQMVTWKQLEPALPPRGKAACVRAADLLEGWPRTCMEDPKKTLLPEESWPDELPKPQVWVENQEEWNEICAGAADRGIFTFLKKQDIFHFRGTPLLNGLFGVEKKNKTLESGQPVLRMIINAIPTNALQEMIEADIRTMPYFVQWSGISVEEEDRVVVWNELDMTSAFLRVPPRAGMVQVPGSGETRFGAIRFKVGARSEGRGKRVPCGGSHGHGMEVSVRTLATDPQETLLPPKTYGSRIGPVQGSSTRWTCSAKRQATECKLLQRIFGWVQPCRAQALEPAQQSRKVELGSGGSARSLAPLGCPISNRKKQSSMNWSWKPLGVELMATQG